MSTMQIGNFDNPKIAKSILHSGREYKPIGPGSRVYFHFVARKCDDDKTEIDDSRKLGQPVQLVIGKQFKLEVWETIVQAMALNEVSSFKVDKSLLYAYPVVAKTLRDAKNPGKAAPRHCCAQTLQVEGLGYDDLNEMMRDPCDLEFIIELLKVENEGEYEQDSWQLNEDQRKSQIPLLKEEGNKLYGEGKYSEAADRYYKAIAFLEQLMLCEKPNDVDWNELNSIKLPILLNFAQCKLVLQDYYAVIEHCSTVLLYQPDNVKALFRRGKAHAAVFNEDEAKKDLDKVAQLDPSLQTTVTSLLKQLEISLKERDYQLKENLKGKLFI